jgi:hypothetical protein
MVPMKAAFFLGGLLAGALLAVGVQQALKEPEDPGRAATDRKALLDAQEAMRRFQQQLDASAAQRVEDARRAAQVQAERDKLAEEVERLRRSPGGAEPEETPGAAPPAPGAPPTDDEIMKGVGKFGAALQQVFLGQGEEAKKEIRDLLARAGKHGIDLLVAKFEDDATGIELRVTVAHALAQSGSPEGIAALTKVLADPEAEMLELRFATHGLAFSDAEGIDDDLLATAHRATDTGARANAAFGLARRKHPEGVGLYAKATDEAMANRDPVALQYLSGFYLLGDEALPPMRERLITYTETQAVVTLIEILKGRGDKGALENLRKLAADEGRPLSVRKSAEGAIKVLEGGGK